ncbi:MAG: adenylate kinase [Rickettsiales bacterium]|nr:adenylate kinase [Rickettsiales bacterium]
MINIIFLGPPGSGKGTQATMLAAELNIPAISAGEALRKEVELRSEIGKLAKSYMNSGDLVPDSVVISIIKNRIIQSDCQNGFILDGFPRNIDQAIALDSMLNSLNKKIDIVFNFEISDEILIKRISGRIMCKQCGAVYNSYFKQPQQAGICDNCKSDQFESRSDDNESTVRNRMRVYKNSTLELIDYYEKKNLLCSIEAIKSVPLVFAQLSAAISKNFPKK